jgi:hypothetical protein
MERGRCLRLTSPPSVRPLNLTTLYASTSCYEASFTLLCVDNVHTSQETRLWTSTAFYRDSFTILYVDDVRTSQETPGAYFIFMIVPQRKHVWAPSACYGIALLFYMFVPHRRHICGPPRSVTKIALLFFLR